MFGIDGRDRRSHGRRSTDRHLVSIPATFGQVAGEAYETVFDTTHLRAKCELQLVETMAATDSVLESLHTALAAAKAARNAAYRAAGTITNEVVR